MKVLFLTDGIHPFVIGGMQKHSLNLAGYLAERGICVNIAHCGGKDYSPASFRAAFSELASKNITETLIPFPKLLRIPGHYIRENRRYSQLIYEKLEHVLSDYDLVYSQGFTGYFFIRQKIKRLHQVPVIVNLHGLEMFQRPPDFKVATQYIGLRKEARYHLLNADRVYSFGGKLDDVLLKIGVPQEKILLQSNGIQDNWLVAGPGSNKIRTFLFIGRNERRKGIVELNAVLRQIVSGKDGDDQFRFHFVGPVPAAARIQDNRIIYHGEIRSQADIVKIIDQCDCLVCPSHAEGMPTVMLEAMARGLAVIATNVGAVSRMINGNGILLDEISETELGSAIMQIRRISAGELAELKLKSIDLVKNNFLWSKVVGSKMGDFNKIHQQSAQFST